jgi:hypothetical protein
MPDQDCFPYLNLPPMQYWSNAISGMPPEERDAQPDGKFEIERSTAIVSAGSCFAQRIADRLRKDGYNYLVTEPGARWLSEDQRTKFDYGRYSARYGNVYTTLQMVQLLERAIGTYGPEESVWTRDAGGFVDPFRPSVQPEGFASVLELEEDRRQHLACTRRAFEECEVFIFTLGLTEVWCDTRDGAAYPMCPGRGVGSFDASRYAFRNLGVVENVDLLSRFAVSLRKINPAVKVLLTVSPVPLIATYSHDHVLRATSHSKAVLLAAAREIQNRYEHVDYFGSYELLWSPCMPPDGFGADSRTITTAGVERVMRSFYRHYAGGGTHDVVAAPVERAESPALAVEEVFRTCDDEAIMKALAQDAVASGDSY